jgi:hypothetical protein
MSHLTVASPPLNSDACKGLNPDAGDRALELRRLRPIVCQVARKLYPASETSGADFGREQFIASGNVQTQQTCRRQKRTMTIPIWVA